MSGREARNILYEHLSVESGDVNRTDVLRFEMVFLGTFAITFFSIDTILLIIPDARIMDMMFPFEHSLEFDEDVLAFVEERADKFFATVDDLLGGTLDQLVSDESVVSFFVVEPRRLGLGVEESLLECGDHSFGGGESGVFHFCFPFCGWCRRRR